jgi:tetratricopeptide (TPR) repeat protein
MNFTCMSGRREVGPPPVWLGGVALDAADARRPPMMGPAAVGEPSFEEDDLLANALLGGGLPSEAEHYLWQAGLSYHLDDVAEAHLKEAQSLAPGHAAVLIGLYRFYFYKGRLKEALEVARTCLAKAADENLLPADWRCVKPGNVDFASFDTMLPRFYLSTLKAYAYLQMRLGNLEEGRAAVMKLLEIEPSDKIGARVLLDVLERTGRDDDE